MCVGFLRGPPTAVELRSPSRGRRGKKKSAKPKPLVVSFKDQVDGVATRRHQELNLASTKPGAYTLELTVADKQGRERKQVQKGSSQGSVSGKAVRRPSTNRPHPECNEGPTQPAPGARWVGPSLRWDEECF